MASDLHLIGFLPPAVQKYKKIQPLTEKKASYKTFLDMTTDM